jgi:hypothetical protein
MDMRSKLESHWLIIQFFFIQMRRIQALTRSHGAWKCRWQVKIGQKSIAAQTIQMWMGRILLVHAMWIIRWDVGLFFVDKQAKLILTLTASSCAASRSLGSFTNLEPYPNSQWEFSKQTDLPGNALWPWVASPAFNPIINRSDSVPAVISPTTLTISFRKSIRQLGAGIWTDAPAVGKHRAITRKADIYLW